MAIKIKIGTGDKAKQESEKKPVQAQVPLKITKTLDGNLLISDHDYLDIVVVPSKNKVLTMPKSDAEKDVFDYQVQFANNMFSGGVSTEKSPEGGSSFGVVEITYPVSENINSLQAVLLQISKFIKENSQENFVAQEYDKNIEDHFVDPDARDSTEYGEIPPYEDTPEGKADYYPAYVYAGQGYMF